MATLDPDREHRWAEERAACLTRWVSTEGARIAALASLEERRAALAQYTPGRPARLRERLEQEVKRLWAR